MSCSIDEQIREAERELALRRNFYRKQVARQLMDPEQAEYRILVMEAILASLKMLRAPTPELQSCFPLVMFFNTEEARDQAVASIQAQHPNLTPRAL